MASLARYSHPNNVFHKRADHTSEPITFTAPFTLQPKYLHNERLHDKNKLILRVLRPWAYASNMIKCIALPAHR